MAILFLTVLVINKHLTLVNIPVCSVTPVYTNQNKEKESDRVEIEKKKDDRTWDQMRAPLNKHKQD